MRRDGEAVHGTPHGYGLLTELARHPGRVLTHRALGAAVSVAGDPAETHDLTVDMANLRRTPEDDPGRPRHLVTGTGVGHRLRTEAPGGTAP